MLISKNPTTGIVNGEFQELTEFEVQTKLQKAQSSFESWRYSSIETRDKLLYSLSEQLIANKQELAEIVTSEIGQPIKSVIAEIEKCAKTAQYYEGKIEEFLAPEVVKTESDEAMAIYEPLGVILGIAPWNFPFWMAFRFIIPTIAAGNTVIVKHASNVPMSAIKIEEIALKAGFPEGVIQTLLIGSSKVEQVIQNPIVKAVSFAGSAKAGTIVASTAGSEIKKTLLELGGSDPFIVFPDAELTTCANTLVDGRLRNAGQACNSPKRVFVHNDIADKYLDFLKDRLKTVKMGNPAELDTEIGPLATEKGLIDVEEQVINSISAGAKLELGGRRVEGDGLFFEPTVVSNVSPGMPLFDEEVFGPVISITTFKNVDDLIKLVNQSSYGLGASIWTKDIELAKSLIPKIEAGNVFINQAVRSDPRLPYGGVKKSGYGRELGSFGIKEFTNVKTVVVNYQG